jgi:hypothetical protein
MEIFDAKPLIAVSEAVRVAEAPDGRERLLEERDSVKSGLFAGGGALKAGVPPPQPESVPTKKADNKKKANTRHL